MTTRERVRVDAGVHVPAQARTALSSHARTGDGAADQVGQPIDGGRSVRGA